MIKQILVSYIFSIGLSFCLGILVRITFIDADIFPQFLLNRFYLPLIPSGVRQIAKNTINGIQHAWFKPIDMFRENYSVAQPSGHIIHIGSLQLPEPPCRLILRELVHITPVHLRIFRKIKSPAIRLRSFSFTHEIRRKLPERMRGGMQGSNGERHARFRDDSVIRLKMAVPKQTLFLCFRNRIDISPFICHTVFAALGSINPFYSGSGSGGRRFDPGCLKRQSGLFTVTPARCFNHLFHRMNLSMRILLHINDRRLIPSFRFEFHPVITIQDIKG